MSVRVSTLKKGKDKILVRSNIYIRRYLRYKRFSDSFLYKVRYRRDYYENTEAYEEPVNLYCVFIRKR